MYFFAMPAIDWYGDPTSTAGLFPSNPRLHNSTVWLANAHALGFANIIDALLTVFQVSTVVRVLCMQCPSKAVCKLLRHHCKSLSSCCKPIAHFDGG
jgi:hypothetical protein